MRTLSLALSLLLLACTPRPDYRTDTQKSEDKILSLVDEERFNEALQIIRDKRDEGTNTRKMDLIEVSIYSQKAGFSIHDVWDLLKKKEAIKQLTEKEDTDINQNEAENEDDKSKVSKSLEALVNKLKRIITMIDLINAIPSVTEKDIAYLELGLERLESMTPLKRYEKNYRITLNVVLLKSLFLERLLPLLSNIGPGSECTIVLDSMVQLFSKMGEVFLSIISDFPQSAEEESLIKLKSSIKSFIATLDNFGDVLIELDQLLSIFETTPVFREQFGQVLNCTKQENVITPETSPSS